MDTRRTWSDLGPRQRASVLGAAILQVALLVAALVDLWRRPREKIRGPKALWSVLVFVNYVGPLAYFVVGRRRD